MVRTESDLSSLYKHSITTTNSPPCASIQPSTEPGYLDDFLAMLFEEKKKKVRTGMEDDNGSIRTLIEKVLVYDVEYMGTYNYKHPLRRRGRRSSVEQFLDNQDNPGIKSFSIPGTLFVFSGLLFAPNIVDLTSSKQDKCSSALFFLTSVGIGLTALSMLIASCIRTTTEIKYRRENFSRKSPVLHLGPNNSQCTGDTAAVSIIVPESASPAFVV